VQASKGGIPARSQLPIGKPSQSKILKMKTLDQLSSPLITLIFTLAMLSLFSALAQYIERNGL
jgi:hypothetical protein